MEAPDRTRGARRERALQVAGLLLVSLFFALWPRSDVWRQGIDRVVPTNPSARHEREGDIDINLSDQRFVVWAVARNARAWVTQPARPFDAEPCHPAEGSLAFSHPILSLGALGVPAWLSSGDPVVTYNVVLVLVDLLAALAMFWLVVEWTGLAAAGAVAALFYAFSPAKIGLGLVTHAMIPDTGWTVLALLFARRVFAGGGWGDALGLAAACIGQLSGSFYPFLASVLVALPFGVWLLASHGLRRIRPAPAIVAVSLIVAAAVGVFGPYVALRHSVIVDRTTQLFSSWTMLAPGAYLRAPVFLLAVAALLLPRRRGLAGIEGDPRWALAIAALLAATMAAGGNVAAQRAAAAAGESVLALPNPYAALAEFVPGLRSIRLPAHLGSGMHLAACVLAGIGTAALLRLAQGRLRRAGEVLAVAAAAAATFATLTHHQVAEIRPDDEALAFFDELERQGNRGPLFEVPITLGWPGYRMMDTSSQIVSSLYHRRRTSGCYGSYGPPILGELERIADGLPSRTGLRELREMGFTTLVVHRDPGNRTRRAYARKIARAARAQPPALRPLHETDRLAAYEILP